MMQSRHAKTMTFSDLLYGAIVDIDLHSVAVNCPGVDCSGGEGKERERRGQTLYHFPDITQGCFALSQYFGKETTTL